MLHRPARRRALLITGTLIALAALPALAWRGFEWDAWREISQAEPPAIESPQAGHKDLLPLLQTAFDSDAVIETTAAWETKRDAIKARLATLIGTPSTIPAFPVGGAVLSDEDLGTYRRLHLHINGEPGDPIPAYLLRPKQLDTPAPVMIVLHQTQAPGKREACGMTGDPSMAFARELVERGVLCIAPDAIGFGERIAEGGEVYDGAHDFYRRHPQWSFFGKMSYDIARVIDYLETLPEVDAQRIGVIGHSHGAYGSIMAAIFEPRIKLVVASCGFTTLRADPRPDRWSHLTALLPRLGFYIEDIEQAPLDWHEIIACIAPRPYFNWATREDSIFPNTDNLASVYTQVTDVYTLYDQPRAFVGKLAPGKHRFPDDVRTEAYDWINAQFEEMK